MDDRRLVSGTSDEDVLGSKKRRRRAPRVMTEARREQNRASQKAFRQRNKERREVLQRRRKKNLPNVQRELRPNVQTVPPAISLPCKEDGTPWEDDSVAAISTAESSRSLLPQLDTSAPENTHQGRLLDLAGLQEQQQQQQQSYVSLAGLSLDQAPIISADHIIPDEYIVNQASTSTDAVSTVGQGDDLTANNLTSITISNESIMLSLDGFGEAEGEPAMENTNTYLDSFKLHQDGNDFSTQLGPLLMTEYHPIISSPFIGGMNGPQMPWMDLGFPQGTERPWTSPSMTPYYFLPWQPGPIGSPASAGTSTTASTPTLFTSNCSRLGTLGSLIQDFQDRGMRIEEMLAAGLENICNQCWTQETPAQASSPRSARSARKVASTPDAARLYAVVSSSDPYLNIIESARTTTFLGLMYNARCIGINIRELLTPNYPSPFYDPDFDPDDETRDRRTGLFASKTAMPANLKPTLPQSTLPHPAYLDLIPFPQLRSRAITLAASAPHVFNPLELKWDLLEDGLMCRRRPHSPSSMNKTFGSANNGSGQPCDMESWEAAPWFLQKWHMLMNDEPDHNNANGTGWDGIWMQNMPSWR